MRFIPLREDNAAMCMAIDEAILLARAENKVPDTLRFYFFTPPAVSIGYFQSAEEEVDFKKVSELKVDVVRRITGGGAVYHDSRNDLTYSIVVSEKNPKIPRNIRESYRVICGAIVSGLSHFGIDAKLAGINDIVVNNKKISGSAQTRKRGVLLQHGTLLIDVNPKIMFSLLKVSDEKIRDKLIKSIEERVTSLKKEIKREIEIDKLIDCLKRGFEETFEEELEEGELTDYEMKLAKKLYEEKYSRREWLFKR